MIVGRVICEQGDDASRVVAQMPVHSEGYFVGPVKESGRPVGFRRQGYLPAEITPSGEPGSVEYVGEVRLKRMPETMASAVRGKIVLEGEIHCDPSRSDPFAYRPVQRSHRTAGVKALAIPAMQRVQLGRVLRVGPVTDRLLGSTSRRLAT